MGFGVADLVITFFFRVMVRAFLYLTSIRWTRTTALLTGHTVIEPLWGCPSVKLSYRFDISGHAIEGCSKVPKLTTYFAKAYSGSFSPNMPKVIRIDPQNTGRTLFFEMDQ